MTRRLETILTKTVGTLLLCLLVVSCQDTVPKRSTISKTTASTGGSTSGSSGGETKVTRPANAISFKSDFCGCKDTKPVTYGNCTTFCSSKNTGGKEIFYANFNVTEDISLGGLGNVYGWCNTLLDGETTNPKCILEAKDDAGNIKNIDVTTLSGMNSVTATINDVLGYDKTYVLTLVESISGLRSNSIQIIKFSEDVPLTSLGPLKNAPISQYTCLYRNFQTDDATGDIYWETMYRLHFYFLPRIPPAPITPGTSNLVCHDIFNSSYGTVDDATYPRLELTEGVFNLWEVNDPRFYDNNNNTYLDVNEVIVQKTKNFGGTIPASTNFFQKFKWPGSPQTGTDAGNNSTEIGYYMAPWIDQTTFKSYCLNSTHYSSTNPLFKAFRDILQVDTEGLYIGVKEAEAVTASNGTVTAGAKDYILIRETDLKSVWFYLKNGVPTAPTDSNVADVAVYFYYPLNKTSPFVKTSTQRIYQVKGAAEFNNSSVSTGGSSSTGAASSLPPHDRKIGCVPKF